GDSGGRLAAASAAGFAPAIGRMAAGLPDAADYAAFQPGESLMAKIIAIHSFRGGTGKSNTTANVAALLAAEGRRVGVIDTHIQSPGIHVLFGLHGDTVEHSLNDYLWGKCSIQQTAHPVLAGAVSGQIFLVPSSI